MAMNPRLLRPLARHQAAPQNPLLTGLVAFWKLDNVNDASGNGNNLTNTNASFAAGRIGNAAYFDGTAYLTKNDGLAVSGTDVSITGWFKNIGSDYEDFLVGCGPADNAMYIVRVGGDLKTSVSENNSELYAGGSGADDGEWHFFAVTRTASVKKIWLDQTVATSSSSFGSLNAFSPFALGSNWDNSYLLLDGYLDAVGLWNRALTDAEIAQLYNGGAGIETLSSTPSVTANISLWTADSFDPVYHWST